MSVFFDKKLLSFEVIIGGEEQESEGDDADKPKPTKPKKNKTKYTCSVVLSIWGKPELNVICGDCEEAFQAVKLNFTALPL